MTKKAALYPGTFDPVTKGHIDIVRRAARIFDPLWVGIAEDSAKKPLFSLAERKEMLEGLLSGFEQNIIVTVFSGLLIDFTKKHKIQCIIRGLRNSFDFEYEFQMSGMNKAMDQNTETVFFIADDSTRFISSHLVKEIAKIGGDTSAFVPEAIRKKLENHWKDS